MSVTLRYRESFSGVACDAIRWGGRMIGLDLLFCVAMSFIVFVSCRGGTLH